MKDKLIIIGASGHGKVVADIAIKLNQWQDIVFLDDDKFKKRCMGLKIEGNVASAFTYTKNADFFVAIGNNSIREEIQERLIFEKQSVISLIHPTAVIGSDVEIGYGTVVMAGVIINSSTTIGNGCVINTSSSIDHDNIIENYVHISPGVRTAGNVSIGKSTWLGIGSVVSNNITIYKNSIIGAGTIVIKDIAESGTYIGIPSRRVKK